ncbi:AAA family ATPase [Candidatus Nitrosotenuis cloacae]|uniref:AAA family ATPase n=1 Tax=Candidatus Nitrosotenuis cloacae TaxID=1603555 RepID=UPI002281A2CD|nr:AAA family ATPase [Candidatus Nitrosotenuis cloacae]
MLSHLYIHNFKSHLDTSLKLGKISVFIGKNGSGKSSLSQAIALLKQSDTQIQWNGDLINLDDFQTVKSRQSQDDTIKIMIKGNMIPTKDIATQLDVENISYKFQFEFNERGLNRIDYEIDGSTKYRFAESLKRNVTPQEQRLDFEGGQFHFRKNLSLKNFIMIGGGSSNDGELYDRVHDALNNFLNTFTNQLELCYLIPATRGFDQSSYQLLDEVAKIQTSKGVTRQAEMSVTTMAHQYDIQEKITEFARQVIPDVSIHVRNLPQKRARIVNKDKYGEYGITNEGFGLNQSIFLFMQLAMAQPNATIFIDEPEISLHPASQTSLSRVLIDDSTKENHQFIITTHSEHILIGLLEGVMDGKILPEDLTVYYFDKIDGTTKTSKLEVTERGEVKGGMKGFFEVNIGHIDKFIENLKKK